MCGRPHPPDAEHCVAFAGSYMNPSYFLWSVGSGIDRTRHGKAHHVSRSSDE